MLEYSTEKPLQITVYRDKVKIGYISMESGKGWYFVPFPFPTITNWSYYKTIEELKNSLV